MIFPLLTFALAAALVAARPAPADISIVMRDDVDCDWCFDALDFCYDNGHTKGQEGCMQTCLEHVCYINTDCKRCGLEFDKCPEVSRYRYVNH